MITKSNDCGAEGRVARHLILPIRLEPKNKQAASWDYASNKSMLRPVKIFKLTINATASRELSSGCRAFTRIK